MDARLGKKIAEGGCAEVYEWSDGNTVIKLAKSNTNDHAMRNEYRNHCVAWDSGLPVTKPVEYLELEGRPAIVYERIHGETIMERFLEQLLEQTSPLTMNNIENGVRLTARMLSLIHRTPPSGSLPSQRENIKISIDSAGYLNPGEKARITSILDALPIKERFCHGDPNPGNLIMRNDNTFAVIDWMNASIGNPEADLAEYIVMVRYAILPSSLPERALAYFDSIREPMIHAFMEEYRKETGVSWQEVDPWLAPIMARKLSADAISDNEKKIMIEEIRRRIA